MKPQKRRPLTAAEIKRAQDKVKNIKPLPPSGTPDTPAEARRRKEFLKERDRKMRAARRQK
jgi:hypothetical protein